MAYPDWKLHGDDTLAAYLPEKEFRGILEKRLAFPPDCAAILIRDGKLIDAYQGAHLSVGGIWQRMKELIGGSHSLRVLVADLKPFPIVVGFAGFTKDHVEIRAELALELQLNPEKPVDIMGLVQNGRSLVRQDVYARIRPHISERVITHELVQHDAEHLRANRGLQDRLQAEIMKEAERIAADMGLLVRAASVNWAQNADEDQAIEIRNRRREDVRRDFEYQRARREIEREAETTIFRLRTDLDVGRVRANSDVELQQLLISNELTLEDARDTGARIKEMKGLQQRIDLAKRSRLALYDERIGDESNELERKRIELERKRMEMGFEADSRRQAIELKKLEQLEEMKVAGAGHDLQYRKLKDLQGLEIDKERSLRDLERDDFMTRHAAEMEKLRLQSQMNPDQLLALQAGLSPEIAKVFSEKAKQVGVEKEALLREMLAMSSKSKGESEAQARAMFDKAVDALAKVGAAAGGGKPGAGGGASGGDVAECGKCHQRVPAEERFCRHCGHQMRT